MMNVAAALSPDYLDLPAFSALFVTMTHCSALSRNRAAYQSRFSANLTSSTPILEGGARQRRIQTL